MALKYIYTKTEDGQQVAKWNVFFYVESVATDNLIEAISNAAHQNQTQIANKIGDLHDLQRAKSPQYDKKKGELILWLTNKVMKKL